MNTCLINFELTYFVVTARLFTVAIGEEVHVAYWSPVPHLQVRAIATGMDDINKLGIALI